jgi:hypothetical protein
MDVLLSGQIEGISNSFNIYLYSHAYLKVHVKIIYSINLIKSTYNNHMLNDICLFNRSTRLKNSSKLNLREIFVHVKRFIIV